MTSARASYLSERRLRLEAALLREHGEPIAPLLPEIERRSLYDDLLAPPLTRRIQRTVTPAEAAQMRELRARGLSPIQIGVRMRFNEWTVRRHTKGVTTR